MACASQSGAGVDGVHRQFEALPHHSQGLIQLSNNFYVLFTNLPVASRCARVCTWTGLADDRGLERPSSCSSRGPNWWQSCRGLKSDSSRVWMRLISAGTRFRTPLAPSSETRAPRDSALRTSRLASCTPDCCVERQTCQPLQKQMNPAKGGERSWPSKFESDSSTSTLHAYLYLLQHEETLGIPSVKVSSIYILHTATPTSHGAEVAALQPLDA